MKNSEERRSRLLPDKSDTKPGTLLVIGAERFKNLNDEEPYRYAGILQMFNSLNKNNLDRGKKTAFIVLERLFDPKYSSYCSTVYMTDKGLLYVQDDVRRAP